MGHSSHGRGVLSKALFVMPKGSQCLFITFRNTKAPIRACLMENASKKSGDPRPEDAADFALVL